MPTTEDHTDRNLDAPSPPGSPMRRDAPSADVNPTPEVQPSGTPDGPAVVPSPSTPEGEPGPDPVQPSTEPSDNAEQDDSLAPDVSGDLGTSSEWVDPTGGVQGTGSSSSTFGRTDGASPTHPGEEIPHVHKDRPGMPDEDDEGAVNSAEVPSQVNDPAKNPGHSHG